MIRKPAQDFRAESALVTNLRMTATGGAAMARAGSYYIRGVFFWGLAALWGFAALAGGLFGSLPTFLGVGSLALGMGWLGARMFAKARG